MAATTPSHAYRLPLAVDEPIASAEALRRARVRAPFRVEALPGAAALTEVPEDADAVLWRPDDGDLGAEDAALDLSAWRDLLSDRKLLVDVGPEHERRTVQALSEAGFVIQRRELLAADAGGEPPRVWLVARVDDVRIRVCRPADEESILELFAPAFHAHRSAEHWRWKYLGNPWGRRWISLAETADGRLAAHYAGYPVPFVRWHGDSPTDLLAVQIGDTMTAPDQRKVGLGWTSLLGRAVRHHFACFGRRGVAFYYGFNTGKIRNFNLHFIRGRWAGAVGYYRRPASGPQVATARGLRAERVEPSADQLWDLPTQDLDDLFARVGRHYRLLVRRDAAWLRWRYSTCPDEPPFFAVTLRSRRRLVGWGVFRRHLDAATGRQQLRWVDALFDPHHAAGAGALLDLALAQPEAQGVEEVTAWFSPRPDWWLDALHRLGFERRSEPDDLGFIYLPFDDPEVDDDIFDLYYTWGDADLT